MTVTHHYDHMVGQRVQKSSNKPFKSTFKINTTKSIIISPYSQKPAFTFHEDDSIVDCHVCELVAIKQSVIS